MLYARFTDRIRTGGSHFSTVYYDVPVERAARNTPCVLVEY